mmetsp:Transcript_30028/g.64543  ORF Transcript_30028/g.64543 Transcript_30028/m.64543 type:complete len:92 (-) Transcript_30028:74-349(-)
MRGDLLEAAAAGELLVDHRSRSQRHKRHPLRKGQAASMLALPERRRLQQLPRTEVAPRVQRKRFERRPAGVLSVWWHACQHGAEETVRLRR